MPAANGNGAGATRSSSSAAATPTSRSRARRSRAARSRCSASPTRRCARPRPSSCSPATAARRPRTSPPPRPTACSRSSDVHGGADYRRRVARACVERALRRARGEDGMRIATTVNGIRYERDVEPRLLLVDFLREDLGLVGTHVGCEHGVCGTCTVLIERRVDPLVHHVRRPGRRPGDHDGRGPRSATARCTRSRRRSGRSRACSAATARRACCCAPPRSSPRTPTRRREEVRRGSRATCAAAPATLHRRLGPRRGEAHARAARRRRDGRTAPTPKSDASRRRTTCAHDDPSQIAPSASGSASRSAASRTRSSSSARAATSTTSRVRGMLHAALVRSPHAHARIVSIDTERRRRRCPACSRS